MTTTADVKALVKPILAVHPEFRLVGRNLILAPVEHIVRSIYISYSMDPDMYVPGYCAFELFSPERFFHFTHGERFPYRPWTKHDPDISQGLLEAIEQIALPKLQGIHTIQDYLEYADEGPSGKRGSGYLDNMAYGIALGDLDWARKYYDLYIAHVDLDNPRPHHVLYMPEIREYKRIGPLLEAEDRVGLAAILHEWEETTVRKLKLEKIWRRTPFPIETM